MRWALLVWQELEQVMLLAGLAGLVQYHPEELLQAPVLHIFSHQCAHL